MAPRTRRVRRSLAAGLIIFLTAGFGLSPVGAGNLDLPIDTVVRAEPGTVTELRRVSVDADLIGSRCELGITAENQDSVHPGNHLVVASGDSHATLHDVEGEAGRVSNTVAPEITLGETVVVSLVMGSDGVFSGGFSVTLSCDDGQSSTEQTVAPTTTTEAPTTTTTGDVGSSGSTTSTTMAGHDPTTTTDLTETTLTETTAPADTTAAPSTTASTEPTGTTAADATTTTDSVGAAGTTSTSEGSVEAASETNDDVLARTGAGSAAMLALIACALILAGVALFSAANLIAVRSSARYHR